MSAKVHSKSGLTVWYCHEHKLAKQLSRAIMIICPWVHILS